MARRSSTDESTSGGMSEKWVSRDNREVLITIFENETISYD